MKMRVHSEHGVEPHELHVTSSDGNQFTGMKFNLSVDDEGHATVELDTAENKFENGVLVRLNHHYVGRIKAIDITFESE